MSRINPTLRGFAIVVLIAVAIWALQLQTALFSLLLISRIAFFLAIAFFLFLLWRDRRGDISRCSSSSWCSGRPATRSGASGAASTHTATRRSGRVPPQGA